MTTTSYVDSEATLEMATIGATFDEHLPPLDTDCSRFSPLSSDRDCPSLSGSFSSFEMNDRRPSFASSAIEDSPGWLSGQSSGVTTPTTPLTAMGPSGMLFDRKQPAPDTPYGFARNELDFFWEPEPQLPISAAALLGTVNESETLGFGADYPSYPHTMGLNNPSLSRSMFGMDGPLSSEDDLSWSHQLSSPQQTIAPSAAFQQPLLTSSPLSRPAPSTPMRRTMTSSSVLGSSPLTLVSPPVVPSQHEPEDIKYEEPEWALLTSEISRHRGLNRISRRGYKHKHNLGSSFKPKPATSKSGIDCEVVIAQNEFACSYPGCIDKQTGKQKRFKRQEHKKRHEKTVHEKNEHGLFKCWVKGCKTAPFTRTDNLKSHLKNTHGKKSPNQRNRYVATQDKNSIHYDPDWVGDLDDEGYPVHSAT